MKHQDCEYCKNPQPPRLSEGKRIVSANPPKIHILTSSEAKWCKIYEKDLTHMTYTNPKTGKVSNKHKNGKKDQTFIKNEKTYVRLKSLVYDEYKEKYITSFEHAVNKVNNELFDKYTGNLFKCKQRDI